MERMPRHVGGTDRIARLSGRHGSLHGPSRGQTTRTSGRWFLAGAAMRRAAYFPNSRFGSHRVRGGQNVTAASTISSGTSHGMIARDIFSNEISAIREVTNSTTPIGGWMVP